MISYKTKHIILDKIKWFVFLGIIISLIQFFYENPYVLFSSLVFFIVVNNSWIKGKILFIFRKKNILSNNGKNIIYFNDGVKKFYFTDVQIKEEYYTKKGLKSGKYNSYIEKNGNKRIESNYLEGKLHGRFVEYSTIGINPKVVPIKIEKYINGEKSGDSLTYKKINVYDIYCEVVYSKRKYLNGKVVKDLATVTETYPI